MSLVKFRIPGTGNRTSDDCNKVVSAEYCKDCGKVEPRFHHCNNWDCPECYFWTASRAAHRVEDRLLGVRRAYAAIGKDPGRVFQVIFSVPLSEYEDFDLEKWYKKVYKYAEEIGMLGGCVVFHPYRIRDEYDKLLVKAVKEAGLQGGKWAGVHADILKLGSWEAYVVYGLHFHVLGYFPRIVMKSNVFHELTGWTYKTVRVTEKRDVFKTARYLLTHHAVIDGKQAVRYFGIASYNKTSVESIKSKSFKACPECGSEEYFLIPCSERRYNQFSEGVQLRDGKFQRVKPADDELVVHVRLVKTVKFYRVRTEQTQLPACAAVA